MIALLLAGVFTEQLCIVQYTNSLTHALTQSSCSTSRKEKLCITANSHTTPLDSDCNNVRTQWSDCASEQTHQTVICRFKCMNEWQMKASVPHLMSTFCALLANVSDSMRFRCSTAIQSSAEVLSPVQGPGVRVRASSVNSSVQLG
jgi:hypothetical protein